jgi:hypothetical protein
MKKREGNVKSMAFKVKEYFSGSFENPGAMIFRMMGERSIPRITARAEAPVIIYIRAQSNPLSFHLTITGTKAFWDIPSANIPLNIMGILMATTTASAYWLEPKEYAKITSLAKPKTLLIKVPKAKDKADLNFIKRSVKRGR